MSLRFWIENALANGTRSVNTSHHTHDGRDRSDLSRREMLARLGGGWGLVGLAAVLSEGLVVRPPMLSAADSELGTGPTTTPLSPKSPHYEPRAKRVIHLFMN